MFLEQTVLPTSETQNAIQFVEEPQSEAGKAVSEALYWAEYYEHPHFSYEWNNGYLEERPVADFVKYLIYRWFVKVLEDFLEVRPIAKSVGLEIGFQFQLPHKKVVRKPDLGIVLDTNPVPLEEHDRTYQGIYDLCIESLSDSTTAEIERDTIHKKREYAMAGVQEYYIIDDRGVETEFYQLAPGGVYQPIQPTADGIICSNVLPGFQFRISDLYRKPSLLEMVDDPVYHSYIAPYYRAERRRSRKVERLWVLERRRVAQEQKRADEEQRRADEESAARKASEEENARLRAEIAHLRGEN